MKERFKNEAFRSGLRYFLIGAAIICFYFFCKNIGVFWGAVDELMRILRPFIIGGIMAYLLCPVYNGTVRFFYVRLHRRLRGKHAMTWARILGTVISMTVLIGLIVAFLALLIPQIFNSIVGLVEVMPGKVSEFSVWVKHMLVESGHRDLADSVDGFINRSTSYGISKLENVFLPGVGSLISKLSAGIINTLKVMLDMLIGLIVCVYVLNGKEILKAKSRRLILVSCGRKRYNGVMDFWNFVNRTFGGFINGKIIDSIIIGIICYVGMLLLKLPFPVLVSTIVGMTNVIPFFGPFIGAIPSSIIICIQDPIKAGIFLIWVFVLQQFDGNILGPAILGGTTGLASFWVMFAIIVGGGVFGVPGMILGVPTVAVIAYYWDRYLSHSLKREGYPSEITDYLEFNSYGADPRDVVDPNYHKPNWGMVDLDSVMRRHRCKAAKGNYVWKRPGKEKQQPEQKNTKSTEDTEEK